jgi:hypothetical protein
VDDLRFFNDWCEQDNGVTVRQAPTRVEVIEDNAGGYSSQTRCRQDGEVSTGPVVIEQARCRFENRPGSQGQGCQGMTDPDAQSPVLLSGADHQSHRQGTETPVQEVGETG